MRWAVIVALGATMGPPASAQWVLERAGAAGSAVLEPGQYVAGELTDARVEIRIGRDGVATGGALVVDFPKEWFAGPSIVPKPVQTDDPAARHFLGASVVRGEAQVSLSVSHLSLAGKSERFRHVVTVEVSSGSLAAGDRVQVLFADTPAPRIAGTAKVTVGVDASGDGRLRLIDGGVPYRVRPAAAASLHVAAPSQGVVGQRLPITVAVLDRFHNPVIGARGRISLSGLGAEPLRGNLGSGSGGVARLRWKPQAAGLVWIVAVADVGDRDRDSQAEVRLEARAGPVRVAASEVATKIYWGDLHSHTELSKDGVGEGDFAFARDVTALDFYASTEHHGDDGYVSSRPLAAGVLPAEWDRIRRQVRDFHAPGAFVTILGYECSLPRGHHNVIFRDLDGEPCGVEVREVGALWNSLEAGHALTIPHHPGIVWGASTAGPTVNWTEPHSREMRPALEIYSAHGQSEIFAPDDPLAYENLDFTVSRSADGPHYALDAWASQLQIAVVAASDNHTAQPGLHHYGLTAVLAPELTREAIFDGLLAGSSYGTTGARILMELEIAGLGMGQAGNVRGRYRGRVSVAAPAMVKLAQLLCFDGAAASWRLAREWQRPGQTLDAAFEDVLSSGWRSCYLRAELDSPIGGRVARAWSSPVWLYADASRQP